MMVNRLLSLWLCLFLFISPVHASSSSVEPAVNGLQLAQSVSPASTLTDAITIKPAQSYTVNLQHYSNGSYQTVDTLKTDEQGKVTLAYPEDIWNKVSISHWRIIVIKTNSTKRYVSQKMTVFTKNREFVKTSGNVSYIYNIEHGLPIYSRNGAKRHDIASLTKIMTAILTLEHCALSDVVKISKEAAKTPWSTVGLKKGDKVTVKNLLYACMLPSSNGSARALAEHVGGSQSKFAKMMNEKAAELGCTNTHFVNAHGLTAKDHYSCAQDIAKILAYAYQNDTFKTIIKTKKYTYKNVSSKIKKKITNRNELLGKSGIEGGKTGFTSPAGHCLACIYTYKKEHYVTVTLGAKKDAYRFSDTMTLVRYIKKWRANPYPIIYHTDYGTISTYAVRTYTSKGATLTPASRRYYKFVGWYNKTFTKKTTKIKAGSTGTKNYYAKWSKIKVKRAKKPKLKSIKTKKIKATWKKTKASGYHLQYTRDSHFKKSMNNRYTSKRSIKLVCAKKKKYYVRIRAYRYDSAGKRVYGEWSKVSSVKVKK